MKLGTRILILILTFMVGMQFDVAAQKPRPHGAPASEKKKSDRISDSSNLLRRRTLDARPLRMFYYFDDTRGYASLQAHTRGVTVLAPQCFEIDGEGFIHGAIPARALEASRLFHFALMPLLFNPGFERATVTSLLHSAAAQERAIDYMAYLAKRDNTAGFQIDLENVNPADQRLFTKFVRRAAVKLHYEGRLLSVAVTPRFTAPKAGTHKTGGGYKGEWSGAYDYSALCRYADFLTLMTYDHSTRTGPPGPIAGYGWVKTALDYAVSHAPRAKLLLGIPLYGREWTNTDGIIDSRSMTSKDVRGLIERPEISVQWNEKWRSPWFEYQDGETQHTVWYEDARSLREKLNLMKQYHLRGFAAWRLGDEGPDFWSLTAEEKAAPSRAQVRTARPATVKRHAKIRPQKSRRLSTEVRPPARAPDTGR